MSVASMKFYLLKGILHLSTFLTTSKSEAHQLEEAKGVEVSADLLPDLIRR